jgi:Phospholipase_D-nuclease N-terminal
MTTGMDPVLVSVLTVVSVLLMLWSLWDLFRPGRQVAGNRKWVWVFIIVIVGLPGQIVYFLIGRRGRGGDDVVPGKSV